MAITPPHSTSLPPVPQRPSLPANPSTSLAPQAIPNAKSALSAKATQTLQLILRHINSSCAPARYTARLSLEEYDSVCRAIAADAELLGYIRHKLRFDWVVPNSGRASFGIYTLRMPSPIHCLFARWLEGKINQELSQFRTVQSGLAENIVDLVRDLRPCATTNVNVAGGVRSPDAGFKLLSSPARTVVIEVAYSERVEVPKRTVSSFLNAGANLVLLFDLQYEPPEERGYNASELSPTYYLYRAERYLDQGILKKRKQVVAEEVPFLDDADDNLTLPLQDFFPSAKPAVNTMLQIPHRVLKEIFDLCLKQQQQFDAFDPKKGIPSDSVWVSSSPPPSCPRLPSSPPLPEDNQQYTGKGKKRARDSSFTPSSDPATATELPPVTRRLRSSDN